MDLTETAMMLDGRHFWRWTTLTLGLAGLLTACSGDEGQGEELRTLESKLGYDAETSHLVVTLNRALHGDEILHARVRSLAEGHELDCAQMAPEIPALSPARAEATYQGPQINPSMFATPTSPETLLDESAEAYQERMANTFFVDVCIMSADGVAHQARYDLRQALDRMGSKGKFDAHDDGVRLESNQAYAEACIGELGDIPFWGERIGEEGELDWKTIDCTEIGTPVPSTVDGEPHAEKVERCDNPQYIYSHCEPDARTGSNGPRVASARNEQGTHWVLLCRKALEAHGGYKDMAMIGHNPFTGQTCFFQNQLPWGTEVRPASNGTRIPHPADNVTSNESPETWSHLWGGIEGGIGPEGGIQCQGCHSTDPFIHTPWIDGAKRDDGTPVVPKMGEHPDFVEGYNGPYKLLDAIDQGWNEPKVLVSEEASACTSCHRIGRDQWTSSGDFSTRSGDNPDGGCVYCSQAPWADRLEGVDEKWDQLVTDSHKSFADVFWMPTNAVDVLNEALWPESEFKKSLDFIRACGANPDDPACVWKTMPKEPGDPTELPEIEETGEELARESLKVLGAPYIDAEGEQQPGTRRCAECHATSRHGLKTWEDRTEEALGAGLDVRQDPEELTEEKARELIAYMREGDEGSVFAAYKIGIYSPGVQFPYFQKLFQKAYGADWGVQYGAFLTRVSMPKGSHPPLSAREFALLAKWFIDEDLAHVRTLLPEIPPPSTCGEVVERYGLAQPKPWLANHVEEMRFDGWAARNEEAGIKMYGCDSADALACFSDPKHGQHPELATDAIADTRVVSLRDFDFNTSFWMRSSADGRFVGNGGGGASGFGATITDLTTGENIGIKGSFDPGFFPNNDGFIMQGGGAGLCGQSVLTNAELAGDGIDFTEPGCSMAEGINLYQHVAVDLAGDYFVINSQFTSDSGNKDEDPHASFSDGSTMKFSPLVFDGTQWTQKEAIVVDSPFEGDSVLSPSGRMVISRFAGPEGKALGYMVRRVKATPNAAGSYDIDIREPVQFICAPGAKANLSFDERFSVTHHYEEGTANLYLTDLLTGQTHKVTNMPEDTEALFPHFRSDGWIYFLAKGPDGDRAMATDAALRLAAAQP